MLYYKSDWIGCFYPTHRSFKEDTMARWIDEQLISMLEGRFAVPKPLAHSLGSDPAEELERKELPGVIAKAFSDIGEREATILRLRFGIGGQSPMTVKEVAKLMNFAQERVRQLEERALIRLRRRLSQMELVS
jgi:RNA polymerase sigma factor (sigma-70 family)